MALPQGCRRQAIGSSPAFNPLLESGQIVRSLRHLIPTREATISQKSRVDPKGGRSETPQ